MSELAYKIRHRVSMFTDRSTTDVTAGEIRQLLDEFGTSERQARQSYDDRIAFEAASREETARLRSAAEETERRANTDCMNSEHYGDRMRQERDRALAAAKKLRFHLRTIWECCPSIQTDKVREIMTADLCDTAWLDGES